MSKDAQAKPTLTAIQRALVKPLLIPDALTDPRIQSAIEALGPEAFTAQLTQHGLGPLWFELLASREELPPGLSALLPALKAARTSAIVASRLQMRMAVEIQSTLSGAGVSAVAFKGVHLGNTLYRDPGLRPSADIDLLIPAGQQAAAVRELRHLGADFLPNPNTLCYQSALRLQQQEIDLHWGFVRPGRTRREVGEILLQHTREADGLQVPDDTGTLLALLIHPLASTRPTAPDAKLVRLIDLALWLERHPVDWARTVQALEAVGCRHIAWLMLSWLAELTDHELATTIPAAITPPPWKQRWLLRWLLADRHGAASGLSVQLGYRTALHSGIGDAVRELYLLGKEKLLARHRLHRFEALLSAGKDTA